MAQPKSNTSVTASITSPIGGWNARDSIAEMPATDAVTLNNFFPTPTDVQLRKGYTQFSLLTTSTGAQTISSITNVTTTATVTTTVAHALATGTQISVSGASPSEYNGVYTITSTGSTTFTYVMASTPATSATTVGAYTIQITDKVNSLMNYATTSQKLFAAAGTKIYDVSSTTASSVHTITVDKLQHINITTPGGSFLSAVNGTDPAALYDGTNWINIATTSTAQTISSITNVTTTATLTTAVAHGLVTGNSITVTGATAAAYNGTFKITKTGNSTFTYVMATNPGGSATVVGTYTVNYAITGVDSSTFIHVNLFKNRLFYTQKNTMKVWYLPVNSVSGAASALDFGGIARNGGYLQAMGTWTIDAGQGADDYAVFVTNMGEVIVYNGTDPSSADTWALKGVWQLGYIFNRRCFLKWGGDLLLLTQDGLVPLASALQSSRLDPRVNITDKIYYAISQEATLYSANFGWQIAYYASENMLIINIPSNEGVKQFCMHTISRAWCSFTGLNANCWELSGDVMYFGSTGYVARFWDAASDNGNNISAEVQQAYSYFDARGQLKRFTLVRPIFQTDNGVPSVLCGVNTDFAVQNDLGAVSFNAISTTTGTWDNAIWDTDLWGGNLSITKNWQGVTGLGFSGGIVMKVVSQGIDVRWASTDYVMERGGVL